MTTSVRDAIARRPFSGIFRSSERGGALYRSVTFLTVFAMLFGGLLLLSPAGASAQSTATTTSALNLRQGPSTGTAIVTTSLLDFFLSMAIWGTTTTVRIAG